MTERNNNKDELRKLVKEMSAHFFASSKSSSPCDSLENIKDNLDIEYTNIINSYLHNMRAMASTASIPFALAHASVCESHYQHIHTIETLESLKTTSNKSPTEDERKAIAAKKTEEHYNDFIKSKDGTNLVIKDTSNFLMKSLLQDDLSNAAPELLNQASVLLWGAFEVFCRDIFIAFLNKHPDSIRLLMDNANARRRFEGTKISIEDLSSFGFNLSSQMGEYLASQQDMSDLATIKTIYFALFPNEDSLTNTLNDTNLWVLGQRRHLIVHRCGIVDQKYIDSTGENLDLGLRMQINPDELEKYMTITCDVSHAIINCATKQ